MTDVTSPAGLPGEGVGREALARKVTWTCEIGPADRLHLPAGADFPMRQAIRRAYFELTGDDNPDISSGWGRAALSSPETTPAPDAGDGWLRHRVALALSTSKHKLVRAVPDGVACICGQYDDSDHGIEASELWRDHLIRAATDVLSASEAGHRTREPHDCFLMSCRDLGPEVVALYDRLTALSSQPAPDPAVIAAEGFTGHKPLPNGKCEHRWRNRQTKAVTCRFADGWHAGQAAALSSPETTPAGVLDEAALREVAKRWLNAVAAKDKVGSWQAGNEMAITILARRG